MMNCMFACCGFACFGLKSLANIGNFFEENMLFLPYGSKFADKARLIPVVHIGYYICPLIRNLRWNVKIP